MRKFYSSLCRSTLGIITIASLVGCGAKPEVATGDGTPKSRPAKLLKVGHPADYALLRYPAVIDSAESTTLAFQVSGLLIDLPVNEASTVKHGDVLAKLDPRDFQNKVNIAQAKFTEAKTSYDKAVNLSKQDAIAGSTLDQRKSDFDVAKANLDVVIKALNDATLTAPFEGVVASIPVKKLQTIQAGSPVISILGRGGLEAKFNIPARIVANSKRDVEDGAETGFVTLEAAPDQRIPAVFKEASLFADGATQTFEITMSFEEPDNLAILPGMNASVWITDPSKRGKTNIISIPATAISVDGDKKYVFVVDEDTMAISKREITIEKDAGSSIYVSSGLKNGETIVSTGVSYLAEGMIVRAWSSISK